MSLNSRSTLPRLKLPEPRAISRRPRGVSHWHGQQQSLLALKGRISFVKMVHEAEGAQLMARLSCDHMEADISSGPAGEATAEVQALGGDGDEA